MKTETVYARIEIPAEEYRSYQLTWPEDEYEKRIRTLLANALAQKLMDKAEFHKYEDVDNRPFCYKPVEYSATITIVTPESEDADN